MSIPIEEKEEFSPVRMAPTERGPISRGLLYFFRFAVNGSLLLVVAYAIYLAHRVIETKFLAHFSPAAPAATPMTTIPALNPDQPATATSTDESAPAQVNTPSAAGDLPEAAASPTSETSTLSTYASAKNHISLYAKDPYTDSGPLDLDGEAMRDFYLKTNKVVVKKGEAPPPPPVEPDLPPASGYSSSSSSSEESAVAKEYPHLDSDAARREYQRLNKQATRTSGQ